MGSSESKDEGTQPNETATPKEQPEIRETRPKTGWATIARDRPREFEKVLNDADSPIDRNASEDQLYHQLHAGVFLKHKTQKYWVDKKSNVDCFMLFARDLKITWADDARYWRWLKTTADDEFTEVAQLLNVCWLEVQGRFETLKLLPQVTYEVVFVVMLKDPAYGWDVPVNLRLFLPDGELQKREENLMVKPRGQWVEIPVGEFYNQEAGQIEFSLYEYKSGWWKKGLLVKGAVIRPKNLH